MARKQMQIPGTERDVIPEIEEAAESWRDARKESKASKEREKSAKYSLIALMGAHKVRRYKYTEADSGEEILLSIDEEPKVHAKKTGEAHSEVGEGLDTEDAAEPRSEVHAGLIAQAEKAQDGSNFEESADGDVIVPDTSVPKKKRGGKKRKAK